MESKLKELNDAIANEEVIKEINEEIGEDLIKASYGWLKQNVGGLNK